jgi:hypothetical protein
MSQPAAGGSTGQLVGAVEGIKRPHAIQQDPVEAVELSLQNQDLIADAGRPEGGSRLLKDVVNLTHQLVKPRRARTRARLQARRDRQFQRHGHSTPSPWDRVDNDWIGAQLHRGAVTVTGCLGLAERCLPERAFVSEEAAPSRVEPG